VAKTGTTKVLNSLAPRKAKEVKEGKFNIQDFAAKTEATVEKAMDQVSMPRRQVMPCACSLDRVALMGNERGPSRSVGTPRIRVDFCSV